jgi:hypothetical protein
LIIIAHYPNVVVFLGKKCQVKDTKQVEKQQFHAQNSNSNPALKPPFQGWINP